MQSFLLLIYFVIFVAKSITYYWLVDEIEDEKIIDDWVLLKNVLLKVDTKANLWRAYSLNLQVTVER